MSPFQQTVRQLCVAYPGGEARALARMVFEECFRLTQTDLLLGKDNDLSADALTKSQNIVERLLRHEPIQYILGYADFCGHRFRVAPGVLIPRPETEELVHRIVADAHALPTPIHILDIGTGSGCIALSLSLALEGCEVEGWDVSPEALAQARQNAEAYPSAQVDFVQEDILHPTATDRQWDIIVSNPPYVCQKEQQGMETNVLQYEPHLALFVSDDDSLLFYREITRFAQSHLSEQGTLWFEINHALVAETAELIEKNGFSHIGIYEDGFGKKRLLRCQR